MVNFVTTARSVADMMQLSYLYLEISVPTKYTDIFYIPPDMYFSTAVFYREYGCVITEIETLSDNKLINRNRRKTMV